MCVAFSIPYYMTTFDHSKKFCLCVFSQVWCTSLWLLKIFPLHCGFNIHLAIFLSKAYCFSALSRFCIQQKGDKCLWQFLRELVGSFEQRHTILEVWSTLLPQESQTRLPLWRSCWTGGNVRQEQENRIRRFKFKNHFIFLKKILGLCFSFLRQLFLTVYACFVIWRQGERRAKRELLSEFDFSFWHVWSWLGYYFSDLFLDLLLE